MLVRTLVMMVALAPVASASPKPLAKERVSVDVAARAPTDGGHTVKYGDPCKVDADCSPSTSFLACEKSKCTHDVSRMTPPT